MDIFNIINENFFSILSSKYKKLYFDALCITHKAFKNAYNLKKDDLISLFIENLYDEIVDVESEAEGEDVPDTNLSSLSYKLFNKLKWAGWISVEYMPNSFDEYVIMADYARKLMNLLIDLMNASPREYNGYVYQTYVLLKDANERRDEYTYQALMDSYKNTMQLDDALRSLLNNIKQYHNSLNEQFEIKDMLKDHFEFKDLIADKIIHPIKTFDSLPRFKSHILKILKEWQYDQDLKEIMVKTSLYKSVIQNQDEARENITIMIGEIIDKYNDVENLLTEIDRKNSIYTRAWVQKITYSLTADKSTKGKLVDIMKTATSGPQEIVGPLMYIMSGSMELSSQEIIDETSITQFRKPKINTEFKPLNTQTGNNEIETEKKTNEFKNKIKIYYSLKKIQDYIREQLEDNEIISSNNLDLNSEENFILFILSVLRSSDSNNNYSIEFYNGYVYVNGYRVPDLLVKKKGRQ